MASRILHIDDDPIILELVKMIFSDDRSLTFVSCLNARDALAVVEDLKPDLNISDISMPDMGGWNSHIGLARIRPSRERRSFFSVGVPATLRSMTPSAIWKPP